MNYNKIGKFIETERKAKNLTQVKLAEKIYVSEKTISKWENGKGVPDTNSLIKLCEVFEVSLNELLNGERFSVENYKSKAEEKLLQYQTDAQETTKRLLRAEMVLGFSSVFSFIIILFGCLYLIYELQIYVLPVILLTLNLVVFILTLSFCLYIEQKAGFYYCEKCKHKYVPSYKKVYLAPHVCRTRYMKCPNCKRRSWHKKIIE